MLKPDIPKVAKDYAKEFGEKHPDIGEVSRGTQLSPAAILELKDVIGAKVKEIEQKGSFMDETASSTAQERSFVRSSADMLARTVYTGVMDFPKTLGVPAVAEPLQRMAKFAYMSSHELPNLHQRLAGVDLTNPEQASNAMDAVVAVTQATATNNPDEFRIHSGNMTDIITASFDALAGMATELGGFPITTYLEGNLQNMLAQFELVEGHK